MTRVRSLLCCSITAFFVLSQAGCSYYAGATTYNVRRTTESAYLYTTERQGQWDASDPPPQAGDIIERPLYRKLERAATYSTQGTSREYEVSELLPPGRYLITSIREIGSAVEGKSTLHYYEVQFEHGTGGVR